jgi:hypothetical protein
MQRCSIFTLGSRGKSARPFSVTASPLRQPASTAFASSALQLSPYWLAVSVSRTRTGFFPTRSKLKRSPTAGGATFTPPSPSVHGISARCGGSGGRLHGRRASHPA